ncbi:MAG: IclR family transcriptional regulator [Gemmobacter sp.]
MAQQGGERTAAEERGGELAPTIVRPVTNAVRILRHLARGRAPETVTAIARALGINTSTCFNILRTLASEGIVAFDERTKSYAIGLGIVQLAQGALTAEGKAAVIRPRLQAMSDRHGVTMTLWRVAENDRNVLISASQSRSAVQIHMDVGQRLPLYIGAFGRVLAAADAVPEAALRAAFDGMRWADPPTFEQYRADVVEAGRRGWARDDGHFAAGVCSVATGVREFDGRMRHGLVATFFRTQLSPAEIEALAGDLLALAGDLAGVN